MMIEDKAILLLEDGTYFEGKAAGHIGESTGEICFNTGMTGYQEIFTDPSYFGQVMVTTNAHIGNYGTKGDDEESDKVQISGLVCKNLNEKYSRIQATDDIQNYLVDNKIVCIHDVDTRALVRHIRGKGAMNCIISTTDQDIDALMNKLKETPSMEGLELASKVSTKNVYTLGDPHSDMKVAVMDFGTKRNILNCLLERGCYLKVFPAETAWSEIESFGADGYFLSNGPGDPAAMGYAIETVEKVLESDKPVFGICLGHQLIALASGISTYKMHHGHRGINHPVINVSSGKCEITSQNHGFSVSPTSIEEHKDRITVTHRNLNDDTIEGISINGKDVFSVQYHPESSPGPHDSRYLFDQFVNNIKQNK